MVNCILNTIKKFVFIWNFTELLIIIFPQLRIGMRPNLIRYFSQLKVLTGQLIENHLLAQALKLASSRLYSTLVHCHVRTHVIDVFYHLYLVIRFTRRTMLHVKLCLSFLENLKTARRPKFYGGGVAKLTAAAAYGGGAHVCCAHIALSLRSNCAI